MVLKLKSARKGGIEFWIKSLMEKNDLKFPVTINADFDISVGCHRIIDAPFQSMSASNFKYEVISE